MGHRLNLEEIGRMAGVSRSTVSRVVNEEPNVSPEAARRVKEVIAETGYRPHAAARSLASNRTGVLGLVIGSAADTLFDDPYFGRLILGATSATNSSGHTLALFLFEQESDEHSIISRVVNPGMVDGVIVTATKMGDPVIEHLRGANMPFVVVGRPDDGGPDYSVDADNYGGARVAALHLASVGRRRLGLITPPSNTTAGADRLAGFLEGLAEAGLTAEGRIYEGNWTEPSGKVQMAKMLSQDVDGVFVGSDRMAVGALRAIHDAGLRCPEDIALVSFDGLLPPDQTNPRLTSISQTVSHAGDRAVQLLQAVIDGKVDGPQHIVLPTKLVVRESCGAQS
jgi:DNA-binding LacI/PurR family transcriptional regulator